MEEKKPPFDAIAQSYDDEFTYSEIGKLQRKRVYNWLEKIDFLTSPRRVFEINCGTGYDAEYFYNKGHKVTATDGSEEMIAFAKANRSSGINFYALNFAQLKDDSNFQEAELLFSNFGGFELFESGSILKTFLD